MCKKKMKEERAGERKGRIGEESKGDENDVRNSSSPLQFSLVYIGQQPAEIHIGGGNPKQIKIN